jgi:hypothetical protein
MTACRPWFPLLRGRASTLLTFLESYLARMEEPAPNSATAIEWAMPSQLCHLPPSHGLAAVDGARNAISNSSTDKRTIRHSVGVAPLSIGRPWLEMTLLAGGALLRRRVRQ